MLNIVLSCIQSDKDITIVDVSVIPNFSLSLFPFPFFVYTCTIPEAEIV